MVTQQWCLLERHWQEHENVTHQVLAGSRLGHYPCSLSWRNNLVHKNLLPKSSTKFYMEDAHINIPAKLYAKRFLYRVLMGKNNQTFCSATSATVALATLASSLENSSIKLYFQETKFLFVSEAGIPLPKSVLDELALLSPIYSLVQRLSSFVSFYFDQRKTGHPDTQKRKTSTHNKKKKEERVRMLIILISSL